MFATAFHPFAKASLGDAPTTAMSDTPTVSVHTEMTETGMIVRVKASTMWPGARASLAASASIDGSASALRVDGVVSTRLDHMTYLVRRPTPLYSEAAFQDQVGMLQAGTLVQGGFPSSEGWIALDDDESWLFMDGRVELLEPFAETSRPFVRLIPLPSGLDLSLAAVQEASDSLIITVPSANQAPNLTAPVPVDVAVPSPPVLSRTLSSDSQAVMTALDSIDEQMQTMQKMSDAAEATLERAGASDLNLELRSQLGQLHGNVNTLLATRIDALLVGALVSGRDAARLKRKALIKQAECLIERTESQVKRFDELRAEVSSPSVQASATGEDEYIVMY